jgi:DNA-binding transcriptional LysR family regulator
MIETRLLYYFLAIAREQSITRAAETLHITQPTLSKQMRDLEISLGTQLFVRGRKKD